MPYKRRSVKRRRIGRRAVTKIARRVVNSRLEEKYINLVLLGSTTDPTTAAPSLMSGSWTFKSVLPTIAEGTTSFERIGNKIRVKRIEFSIQIEPAIHSAMVDGGAGRVVVYHNKQATGALPSAAMVWDTNRLATLRNTAQTKRISILKDYTHQMVVYASNGGAVFSAGPSTFFKWVVYPKKTIQYTANTADISDILMDDYGIGFVGEANCCQGYILAKVIYTDA